MKLPDHFMIASDGDLLRFTAGSLTHRTIREKYRYTFSRITNTHEMRSTLRNGPYAWPGGYPLFFIFSDSEALCFKCARSEYRQISDSIRNHSRDGWQVMYCDVNYEDSSLYCAHCNERIESAYGETDNA